MIKMIAVAAFAVTLPVLASAAEIGGHYRVTGTNFDGSQYSGLAEIVATTPNTCRITWDTGSTAEGICMRNTDAFAAAYAMGDAIGLVIYQVHPDGVLEGLWTIADQEGVGTEVLTPLD